MDKAGFEAIKKATKKKNTPLVSLRYAPGSQVQLGFAITKKVGNAVVRNKLRRRTKEIMKAMELVPGYYFLSFRPGAAELNFAELRAVLQTLCK